MPSRACARTSSGASASCAVVSSTTHGVLRVCRNSRTARSAAGSAISRTAFSDSRCLEAQLHSLTSGAARGGEREIACGCSLPCLSARPTVPAAFATQSVFQEVERADARRLHGGSDGAVTGHHHDRISATGARHSLRSVIPSCPASRCRGARGRPRARAKGAALPPRSPRGARCSPLPRESRRALPDTISSSTTRICCMGDYGFGAFTSGLGITRGFALCDFAAAVGS